MYIKTILALVIGILFELPLQSTPSKKEIVTPACSEIDTNIVPYRIEDILLDAYPGGKSIMVLKLKPIPEIVEKKQTVTRQVSTDQNKKRVWITAYWSYPRQDDWTHKKESSTGTTLKEGKHVAVDPDVIPYGSKIHLPDGTVRKAVDTGDAVKKKTASRGKYIVIDVYFTTKETAERWLAKYSEKQWVTILSSKA